MCLVKVREDPDIVVPYRVHHHHRPRSPHSHSTRVSRTIIEERPQPRRSVPTPAPLVIPPPQPVPIFVQPPPAPPPPPSSHPQHVYVSPASSHTSVSSSDGRSDYVYRREVRREREYSPARSSAYGDRYETYRYVDPPPESPRYYVNGRSRSRSVDRRRYVEEEPERVRTRIVVEDSGRRREYRN